MLQLPFLCTGVMFIANNNVVCFSWQASVLATIQVMDWFPFVTSAGVSDAEHYIAISLIAEAWL